MATFKELRGVNIPIRSSDLANPKLGEVWYNTTTHALKAQVLQTASWATGGARSNATFRGAAFGITTAAVASGGTQTPPLPSGPINNTTELYNGTSWTGGTAAPLNLGYVTSGGTETAGIVNTGESPPGSGTTTIEYSGGSWTSGGTRTFASQNALGAGTQTSYICIGGQFQPSYSPKNNVSCYDGTSWTSKPTYPTNTAAGGACGNDDLAYAYGGDAGSGAISTAADWSGSSWTTGASLPTATKNMSYNSSGSTTDAIAANGSPAVPTSLIYNGTSWSTTATSNNALPQGIMAGAATTAGCVRWGSPGPSGFQFTTEEYTGGGSATQTVTAS